MTEIVPAENSVGSNLADASPKLKARLAGAFYVITIVTGGYGEFASRGTHLGHLAVLIAGAAYVVVLLYYLLKPVNVSLALLAAFFSLVGIASSNDSFFFFGLYCLTIGYLIFQSTFLPRTIGVLMALAGVGLLSSSTLTVMSPALAHSLSMVNTALDGAGEVSLTLWLLIFGVNVPKWNAKRLGS